MPVELETANMMGELSPGTFSDVLWLVPRSYPTLFVPTSAVANTLERVFVVRIKDGKSEWVDVKTGANVDKMTRSSAIFTRVIWSQSVERMNFALAQLFRSSKTHNSRHGHNDR